MKTVIINARIYRNGSFTDGGIVFDDKIREIGPSVTAVPGENVIDAAGAYVIPGLVDIHTHAALGKDASDGDPDGIYVLGQYYAKEGVTSWCPTTMTVGQPELIRAVRAIAAYQRTSDGAKVAGIHLEGPFISYEKRGAQNPQYIHKPDYDMLMRLQDACGGIVRLVTIAPEAEGAEDFIRKTSRIITVSLGHTTADYDTALAAFEAGASHVTHLFNAMPPLAHRAPGVIGAAFDAGASAELITDGLHVSPSVIRIAAKLFGEKLCLISDSLRCAGMPDGEYELGGQTVELKDGKACLKGTDTLAGSRISLMEGMRRSVSFGIPLEKAVAAATIAPARVIRRDDRIGSLEAGKDADLVILDRDLNVRAVFIDGLRSTR